MAVSSGNGQRVVIAMSGGVDSSVAAALLVEQGFDVIGIMLRLWQEPNTNSVNRCCSPDAMALARKVAVKLGIPFYAVDVQEEFKNSVVDYFIDGYRNYITPNPCLVCNREIRWGLLYMRARSLDAEFLATGHYARIQQNAKKKLLKAIDKAKDQSYVLHSLNQEQLAHTLFPIGWYTKSQVREIATRYSLPIANLKDSQDLCFLGNEDYRSFLRRHAPETQEPGRIINLQGKVIGNHSGIVNYTIGQRKGLGISAPEPLYVIDKDSENNQLVVANENDRGKSELTAHDVNWIAGSAPDSPFWANVKIRYRASEIRGLVKPIADNRMSIKFETQLNDITPGQAAVVYIDDTCLGGGLITKFSPNLSEER